MLLHPFDPVFDRDSRMLILGSFPSVRSREDRFYYAHPKNRFWPLMARLLRARLPQSDDEKRCLLLGHGIALWDVVGSCKIVGSSDARITDAVPNPIATLVDSTHIGVILLNGRVAARLYQRTVRPFPDRPFRVLPSTSAANAAWGFDRLAVAWGEAMGLSDGRG